MSLDRLFYLFRRHIKRCSLTEKNDNLKRITLLGRIIEQKINPATYGHCYRLFTLGQRITLRASAAVRRTAPVFPE
jgi:hypothetical protein